MKRPILLFVLLLSGLSVCGQTVKRLYIANDDHTDYMWTADEAKYDSAFVQMLDYYLRQVDSTRNEPADFQARFNCDASYWLRAYEKYRTPAQFERLIGAIRSEHISSPLNTLVSTYGAQPAEAVLRGMYYAGSLERRHNLRFRLAQSMENNTIPLGLSSLWAGSGVKYSYKGIGGYGSQMTYPYRAGRRNQLYRYTGLDGSGVLTKWYDYPNAKSALGGYAECRLYPKNRKVSQTTEIEQAIDVLDAHTGTPTYPFSIGAAFGYGWDDLATFVSQPFLVAARNKTIPTRRVRVSNEEDFFRDVEQTYPNLPAESVSYGNEWDIYCASMNETTARVRRSVEKLRTAEGLASIVSLRQPLFADGLKLARASAWEALGMYWEHNWTADGPVSRGIRAAWQNKLEKNLSSYVDSLQQLSAQTLGRQFSKTAGLRSAAPRFFVFNPLSWTRNDVADLPYEGAFPAKIVDVATGKEVASQRVTKAGKLYLRIWAEGIPSVGYKLFEIRQGQPANRPEAATVTGPTGEKTIRNAFYQLKLSSSGAITEWIDRTAGRRTAGNRSLVLPGRYLNDLGVQKPDAGTLTVENRGPVSVTLKAVSDHPVRHVVRLTVYTNSQTRTGEPAGRPRIEIEDSILVNFANVRTWSFAFNLKNQTTRHEEVGAILTARKETGAGRRSGGHYAARHARLDWQTFNHFADLSEAAYGVTISNQDCSFFKLGESKVDSLWEDSPVLHALAGGQVDKKIEDGGYMGIFNQNGQKAFQYKFALTSHRTAFDATAAMKFSLEHQNPLVTGWATGHASAPNAPTFSLLSNNDPNVLLWAVKPAEEGLDKGLITRWWNLGNRPATPTIRLATPIRQAWHTSHLETDERQLNPTNGILKDTLRQHQLKTYRLRVTPGSERKPIR